MEKQASTIEILKMVLFLSTGMTLTVACTESNRSPNGPDSNGGMEEAPVTQQSDTSRADTTKVLKIGTGAIRKTDRSTNESVPGEGPYPRLKSSYSWWSGINLQAVPNTENRRHQR